jgi:hypothetical protein
MSEKLKTIQGNQMDPETITTETFRACRDEDDNWVIEAVRREVKLICRCSDEAEAKLIEMSLNATTEQQ